MNFRKFIKAGDGHAKKPRKRAQFDLRGRLMLVGGALVAKTVYDNRKRIRENPSKVIIDQKAD